MLSALRWNRPELLTGGIGTVFFGHGVFEFGTIDIQRRRIDDVSASVGPVLAIALVSEIPRDAEQRNCGIKAREKFPDSE